MISKTKTKRLLPFLPLPWFKPHHRLIFCFLVGIILSLITTPTLLVILAALAILLLLISHCPTRELRFWLMGNLFMALIWLTLFWQLKFQPGLHFSLNPQGIHLALLITLKFNIIFALTRFLLGHYRQMELIQIVSQLKLPTKLITLVILMLNYINVFKELKEKQKLAMKARGYQVQWNSKTLPTLALQLALLLVNALDQAEQVTRALKARKFKT